MAHRRALNPEACASVTSHAAKEMKLSDKPSINLIEMYLGPPPLLEGEDEAHYLRLQTAVFEDMNPSSIFDFIVVRDIVDKLWEEQRCKRAAMALIKGGTAEALKYYLNEIYRGVEADDWWDKYCNGDAKGRKAVLSNLEQHGITFAQLQAKAAQIESTGLLLFDRMVAARENGRRLLRKDAEHYSRNQDDDADEVTK
jgi:hypothetical protein